MHPHPISLSAPRGKWERGAGNIWQRLIRKTMAAIGATSSGNVLPLYEVPGCSSF